MPKFENILEQIALSLDAHGMPYMVIGGQAVLVYGEARFTNDIDVSVGVSTDRLGELLRLVQDRGWKLLVSNPAEFVQKTLVLPCGDPASGLRLDFIFAISPYEQKAIERARGVAMGKATVCFASVEDVIIHKVVAGRPRDLEDVRNILLKNQLIDANYVRQWLKEFDLSLSEEHLKRFEAIWAKSEPEPRPGGSSSPT